MQELKPITSIAKTPLFAFCPLTEAEISKRLLSSHPTTCPSSSYLSFTLNSTHTHYQHISPYRHLPQCIQTGSGNPTAKNKPTLNTLLTDSYRPVSLFPFIAKTLERVVFNQLSSFLSKHNLLDANQSGFRCGHSTETALLGHWSPANCKSWFQIISSHSAESICCFCHCQPSDSPDHPLITGHHRDSTSLIWILSQWQAF